jgi:mannose-6-phosphate isomerase
MVLDFEHRPWGAWYVLDQGDLYKVKRIEVEPGKRLSLQTHGRRSEHWYVVTGVATCQVGDDTVVLHKGESVVVPLGVAHRISNLHDEPLLIIEVQHGDYLGEDDICRLEDDYGRTPVTH